MKRLLVIFVFAVCCGAVWSQINPEYQPQRTPEEIAQKQNATLIRELGLRDSVQLDTLYRMHLKYARMRQVSNTRAEDLQRMQAMIAELEHILTPEQYQQFMEHQFDDRPRHPHAIYRQPADTPKIQARP